MSDFTAISTAELDTVVGGRAHHHRQQPASTNPLHFLDGPYKSLVFNVAGNIGGTKLAQKMYGSRMTAADTARAQAAMKQFLVAGNKLPQGVPNLFG